MKVTVSFSEIHMFERRIIIDFFKKCPFRALLVNCFCIRFFLTV
jgi:hypothetical protein